MSVANILTASRILLSPLFVIIFLGCEGLLARIFTLLLVVIMELTDAFDGYFARKRNEVSDFGKILDPLADSLSRLTIFISFLVAGIAPIWMVLVFLYRDSTISTIRIVCAYNKLVLAALRSGKIKAIVQATAIITILVGRIAEYYFGEILKHNWAIVFPWQRIYYWLLVVAVLITIYSLYDYVRKNWTSLKPFIR
ncbi:MAG: CDP-diacylglycerol--glycerol-3-phosphate 3-phosphatidyltransferase [Candidatus Delongbacteria bacterium]|nr:CDP-diacylglycerol--glycerol-3-phosphate 3-phosphatidyltransferase [bacterium]MBL7032818.1 CDP-diacylglycerol--glycerol-3-phosphate 3-phosphatidyltransferase [Candidatus Delongbacteria bacterium]